MLIVIGLIALVIIVARRTPASRPPKIPGGTENHRGMFGKL